MEWLQKLLPKQKMQDVGHGNVQAGRVEGDLQNTQHSNNQTIYNNFYLLSPDPKLGVSQELKRPSFPERSADSGEAALQKPATYEQLEVLRIMRCSPSAQAYAEDFMRNQFGSIRVKGLNDLECRRTKAWVQACLKNEMSRTPADTGASCG